MVVRCKLWEICEVKMCKHYKIHVLTDDCFLACKQNVLAQCFGDENQENIVSDIDVKILELNGVKVSYQRTIIEKPFWCPDKKMNCAICLYTGRCNFNK
jgi:hypothetical protein